jgi:poly(hydroxyalkanoate) depolymerase family esterase
VTWWQRLRGAPPGRWLAGQHPAVHSEIGDPSRHYKLFVPGGPAGAPRPLVVMLHGCTQDPDDFARGTRMNELAQAHGFLVLYPEQPPRSNANKCWNWFMPGDQRRGRGEPALLAGMTQQVIDQHGVDPDRVFVAGLSAGAAMAVILAHEYTDVFAAAGIVAGLAQGAAFDPASAFHAMKAGPSLLRRFQFTGPGAPVIVLHGDADTVVHPINGQRVIDDLMQGLVLEKVVPRPKVDIGTAGGRDITRTVYRDAQGVVHAEHVEIHGAAHTWPGGSPAGTGTDPKGPDASREIWRFFEEHPRAPSRVAQP